jgi:hypothetical protein
VLICENLEVFKNVITHSSPRSEFLRYPTFLYITAQRDAALQKCEILVIHAKFGGKTRLDVRETDVWTRLRWILRRKQRGAGLDEAGSQVCTMVSFGISGVDTGGCCYTVRISCSVRVRMESAL